MQNRPLTLEEVLALPERARVYGEITPSFDRNRSCSGEYERSGWFFVQRIDHMPMLLGIKMGGFEAGKWRVWLREPTPAELAANPWP